MIENGTYTLVYKDSTHFTFKVSTVKKGPLAGRQIVSYLCGSDNETDYNGLAFVAPDGTVSVWGKHRGTALETRANHLNILFTMPDRLEAAGMAYALASGRCRRCDLKLTVPASLHAGYGPECRKKIGLAA